MFSHECTPPSSVRHCLSLCTFQDVQLVSLEEQTGSSYTRTQGERHSGTAALRPHSACLKLRSGIQPGGHNQHHLHPHSTGRGLALGEATDPGVVVGWTVLERSDLQ